VPESPRWLFIHGHDREADRLVEDIERTIAEETGRELPPPEGEPIEIRQRKSTSFVEIARTMVPDDGPLVPAPVRARPRPVHRPGVPLQRGVLHPGAGPVHVLRGGLRLLGVNAEQKSLEDIVEPLSAESVESTRQS
jgi:hypothetical protein